MIIRNDDEVNKDLNDLIKVVVITKDPYFKDLDGTYETFTDLYTKIRDYCEQNLDFKGRDNWLEIDLPNKTLVVEEYYSGMNYDRPSYEVVARFTYLKESEIKKRAYFIYLENGNTDSVVNYYKALSDMLNE